MRTVNLGQPAGRDRAAIDRWVENSLREIERASRLEQNEKGAVYLKDFGTAGVVSSGTVKPDPLDGEFFQWTNGGAYTFAPSANYGRYTVQITNNASAGATTTSGFTKVTGSFTTTNGHKFTCHVTIGPAGSLLEIVAMQ